MNSQLQYQTTPEFLAGTRATSQNMWRWRNEEKIGAAQFEDFCVDIGWAVEFTRNAVKERTGTELGVRYTGGFNCSGKENPSGVEFTRVKDKIHIIMPPDVFRKPYWQLYCRPEIITAKMDGLGSPVTTASFMRKHHMGNILDILLAENTINEAQKSEIFEKALAHMQAGPKLQAATSKDFLKQTALGSYKQHAWKANFGQALRPQLFEQFCGDMVWGIEHVIKKSGLKISPENHSLYFRCSKSDPLLEIGAGTAFKICKAAKGKNLEIAINQHAAQIFEGSYLSNETYKADIRIGGIKR